MKIGITSYFILSLLFVFLATLVNVGFSTILFQSAIFFGFLIIMRIKLDEDLSNMILGLFSVAPAVFCIGIINKYDLLEHFGEYLGSFTEENFWLLFVLFTIIGGIWLYFNYWTSSWPFNVSCSYSTEQDAASRSKEIRQEELTHSEAPSPDPTLNNK